MTGTRGTYFKVDEAIRERGCSICHGVIESGEHHGVFCSNSYYDKNICQNCIRERLQKIERLEKRGLKEFVK